MAEVLSYDDWLEQSGLREKVVLTVHVEVDDEVVFESTYASIDDAYAEGRKPDRSVEAALSARYETYVAEQEEDEDDE